MTKQPKADDAAILRRFLQETAAPLLDELTRFETCFSSDELQLALSGLPADVLPAHLHRVALARLIKTPRLVTQLGNGKLTCTTLLQREKQMDAMGRALAADKSPIVSRAAFDTALKALDQHYADQEQEADPAYQAALKQLLAPGALKLLEGPPGAHKSEMIHLLIEARRNSNDKRKSNTLVTADSDRVTSSLAEEAKCSGAVLDKVLDTFAKGKSPLPKGGLVIVDEAAMLGTRRMASLLKGAKDHGLNLILIGDSQQMPPRTAGQPFRWLTKIAPTAQLDKTWRQRKPDERMATIALRDGNAARAVQVYADKGRVSFAPKRKAVLRATVDAYVERRVSNLHSPRSMLMVGMTPKDADKMNKLVRKALTAENVIGASKNVTTATGETLPLAMGDRILITETVTPPGHDRPVWAGSAGMVTRMTGKWIDILLDGKQPRAMRLPLEQPVPVAHGYAIDLRRAQGLKADHTYIAVTQQLGPGSGLVAFSRHKRSARFFVNEKVFGKLPQLSRALTGDPWKAMALDMAKPAPHAKAETPKADRRQPVMMPSF